MALWKYTFIIDVTLHHALWNCMILYLEFIIFGVPKLVPTIINVDAIKFSCFRHFHYCFPNQGSRFHFCFVKLKVARDFSEPF